MANPLSDYGVSDRDYAAAIATAVGEAGVDGLTGMAAVMDVVANRMDDPQAYGGRAATLADVAFAPGQFDANAPRGRAGISNAARDASRAALAAALDPAVQRTLDPGLQEQIALAHVAAFGVLGAGTLRGISRGATFFQNPEAARAPGPQNRMAQRNGSLRIGNHVLTGPNFNRNTTFNTHLAVVDTITALEAAKFSPEMAIAYDQIAPAVATIVDNISLPAPDLPGPLTGLPASLDERMGSFLVGPEQGPLFGDPGVFDVDAPGPLAGPEMQGPAEPFGPPAGLQDFSVDGREYGTKTPSVARGQIGPRDFSLMQTAPMGAFPGFGKGITPFGDVSPQALTQGVGPGDLFGIGSASVGIAGIGPASFDDRFGPDAPAPAQQLGAPFAQSQTTPQGTFAGFGDGIESVPSFSDDREFGGKAFGPGIGPNAGRALDDLGDSRGFGKGPTGRESAIAAALQGGFSGLPGLDAIPGFGPGPTPTAPAAQEAPGFDASRFNDVPEARSISPFGFSGIEPGRAISPTTFEGAFAAPPTAASFDDRYGAPPASSFDDRFGGLPSFAGGQTFNVASGIGDVAPGRLGSEVTPFGQPESVASRSIGPFDFADPGLSMAGLGTPRGMSDVFGLGGMGPGAAFGDRFGEDRGLMPSFAGGAFNVSRGVGPPGMADFSRGISPTSPASAGLFAGPGVSFDAPSVDIGIGPVFGAGPGFGVFGRNNNTIESAFSTDPAVSFGRDAFGVGPRASIADAAPLSGLGFNTPGYGAPSFGLPAGFEATPGPATPSMSDLDQEGFSFSATPASRSPSFMGVQNSSLGMGFGNVGFGPFGTQPTGPTLGPGAIQQAFQTVTENIPALTREVTVPVSAPAPAAPQPRGAPVEFGPDHGSLTDEEEMESAEFTPDKAQRTASRPSFRTETRVVSPARTITRTVPISVPTVALPTIDEGVTAFGEENSLPGPADYAALGLNISDYFSDYNAGLAAPMNDPARGVPGFAGAKMDESPLGNINQQNAIDALTGQQSRGIAAALMDIGRPGVFGVDYGISRPGDLMTNLFGPSMQMGLPGTTYGPGAVGPGASMGGSDFGGPAGPGPDGQGGYNDGWGGASPGPSGTGFAGGVGENGMGPGTGHGNTGPDGSWGGGWGGMGTGNTGGVGENGMGGGMGGDTGGGVGEGGMGNSGGTDSNGNQGSDSGSESGW